ncbi:MAG: response regulator [Deltaproteobacteria bacterium]|nr:response regulator [Deltaproteobacteria bacterium]
MASILVIDDDTQLRTMLKNLLQRNGFIVMDAPDGKVGMNLFRRSPTDLVITDIIMQEKEGIETIMELRDDFPEVKIIAMSGGGQIGPEVYLDVARGLGANHILTKPFNSNELLEIVRELLDVKIQD